MTTTTSAYGTGAFVVAVSRSARTVGKDQRPGFETLAHASLSCPVLQSADSYDVLPEPLPLDQSPFACLCCRNASAPAPVVGYDSVDTLPRSSTSTSTSTPAPRPAVAGPAPTDRQVAFWTKLRSERGLDTTPITGWTKLSISKLIDELLHTPRPQADKPSTPAPKVAAGHYAIPSATGNNDLDFFKVDRPTEGKWAGYTFVRRVIGGHSDVSIRGTEARKVLVAIAADPDAAARYGQTIGRCYVCNRHLTDETSRALGIGPECRSKQ